MLENVRVAPGLTTRADYALKPQYFEMDPFEVIAEPYEEQSVAILEERQSSAIMTDSLGSDFLSKVGAGDAAEALTKVTGATIVGGKFAVVRGLSDRYTTATLNGAEIPSADPYRKAVQLDLFPSAMIDTIAVSKTFTPDQPGGFTGGLIDIRTKSFPEKFTFSIGVGAGYNTATTLRDDFASYDGGRPTGSGWMTARARCRNSSATSPRAI
ncbi:MAG: TonB-dependent receptor plug domain-containing protein [Verrucomicrobiae bacterium]|nr:TonB-dependent receptor plug domain-containing protein [Verrucomicrobiae bacterium]